MTPIRVRMMAAYGGWMNGRMLDLCGALPHAEAQARSRRLLQIDPRRRRSSDLWRCGHAHVQSRHASSQPVDHADETARCGAPVSQICPGCRRSMTGRCARAANVIGRGLYICGGARRMPSAFTANGGAHEKHIKAGAGACGGSSRGSGVRRMPGSLQRHGADSKHAGASGPIDTCPVDTRIGVNGDCRGRHGNPDAESDTTDDRSTKGIERRKKVSLPSAGIVAGALVWERPAQPCCSATNFSSQRMS